MKLWRMCNLMVCGVLVSLVSFAQRLDLSQSVSLKNGFRYHLQGVAADMSGIYWSFSDTLVKTDWAGKKLAELELFLHCGDICLREGKLYVSVNRRVKHTKNTGFLYILNGETLQQERVVEIPEAPHPDGIAWLGDELFVAEDAYGFPWHRVNVVCVFDRNLKFKRRFKVDTGIEVNYGVQTLESWGNRLIGGFYSKKQPSTWVFDAQGKRLHSLPFYCAEGVAQVPKEIAGEENVFIVCSSTQPRGNWGGKGRFFRLQGQKAIQLSK